MVGMTRTVYRAVGGGWPLTKRLLDFWDYEGWVPEQRDVFMTDSVRRIVGIPSIFV